ncbi:MAG: NAD(P)-dependent oxidoreductase [Synergistaceae bacterium]|jgi:nucleoside-diphosphate-sugar epimerase|nr:NAD(P)-dependent oxidoreductase [Synergistaceae bacterium]
MCARKKKETVLVTGAGGFIGRYVVKELSDNYPYDIHAFRGDLFSTNLDYYVGRLAPSYLINLAWVTGEGYLDSRENLMFVQKSLELYDAFYGYGGKRAVFIGTEQEYERSDKPLTETGAISPISYYAECKADLGRILLKSSEVGGNGFVWCRLFFIYGAGERPKHLAPSLIRGLLANERVDCPYEGLVRDYVYVKDVAGAICHCLASGFSGAVNISGGRDTTIGELAELVGKNTNTGGEVVFQKREECGHFPYIRGDISRLESLGWTHRYSLEEGLREEIQEIRAEMNGEK